MEDPDTDLEEEMAELEEELKRKPTLEEEKKY